MNKTIKLSLIIIFAHTSFAMNHEGLLLNEPKKRSSSVFFRTNKKPKEFNIIQNQILEAIRNKTLSIETTMNGLKRGRIDMSHLPEAFFSYHSREEFKCSPLVSAINFTPLMWLVMHVRDPYFYDLLLKSPYSEAFLKAIDEKNSKGWTATMLASRNANTWSHDDALRYLLNAKADPDLQNDEGWTALMVAARYANSESSDEAVRMLLAAKAKTNLQNKRGWTALMHCAGSANVDSNETAATLLLDAGADPNIEDYNGWTALTLAALYVQCDGTERVFNLLFEKSAIITPKQLLLVAQHRR